jgi:hypothetical protein
MLRRERFEIDLNHGIGNWLAYFWASPNCQFAAVKSKVQTNRDSEASAYRRYCILASRRQLSAN